MSDRTQYFRKFPLTVYKDVPSINILRRVDFSKNIRNYLSAFYKFEKPEGERVETVAHDYYNDVDLDWLIYLTNDIVDPYHDTSLDSDDFENTIIKKYGSIENAKKKTFVYRNNYRADDQIITTESYNSLIGERKKYWSPVIGSFGVLGYERTKEEIYASTNMIITFSINANTAFVQDEIVNMSGNRGSATVSFANTSTVTLRHISGDWNIQTSDFEVSGEISGAIATFNYTTYTKIQDVIPETEQVYFSKYSYYDYEDELNDQKREVYLIDQDYALIVNKQLDQLMK